MMEQKGLWRDGDGTERSVDCQWNRKACGVMGMEQKGLWGDGDGTERPVK